MNFDRIIVLFNISIVERVNSGGWVWVWLTETLTQPVFEHFTPSIFGNDRDFEDGSNAQTQPL